MSWRRLYLGKSAKLSHFIRKDLWPVWSSAELPQFMFLCQDEGGRMRSFGGLVGGPWLRWNLHLCFQAIKAGNQRRLGSIPYSPKGVVSDHPKENQDIPGTDS
ncbi:hypothetical protein L2E82_51533 [Cichorium intybus]|nr:hypothetical protein L2E82_51533 [Cichorium intybus]